MGNNPGSILPSPFASPVANRGPGSPLPNSPSQPTTTAASQITPSTREGGSAAASGLTHPPGLGGDEGNQLVAPRALSGDHSHSSTGTVELVDGHPHPQKSLSPLPLSPTPASSSSSSLSSSTSSSSSFTSSSSSSSSSVVFGRGNTKSGSSSTSSPSISGSGAGGQILTVVSSSKPSIEALLTEAEKSLKEIPRFVPLERSALGSSLQLSSQSMLETCRIYQVHMRTTAHVLTSNQAVLRDRMRKTSDLTARHAAGLSAHFAHIRRLEGQLASLEVLEKQVLHVKKTIVDVLSLAGRLNNLLPPADRLPTLKLVDKHHPAGSTSNRIEKP